MQSALARGQAVGRATKGSWSRTCVSFFMRAFGALTASQPLWLQTEVAGIIMHVNFEYL